jgi:hypothetical protein
MHPSVLDARDRFLEATGTVFPNLAKMMPSSPDDVRCVHSKTSVSDDLCGFNLGFMNDFAQKEGFIGFAPTKNLMANDSVIAEFDLNTVIAQQLNISAPFSLVPFEGTDMNAFLLKFDEPNGEITFSTSLLERRHTGRSAFRIC